MKLAVLTDIHANRPALAAVLADATARGAKAFAILGDIVGYGPEPGACIDRIRALNPTICVKGNHDHAIAQPSEPMSPHAATAIQWTRAQLTPDQAAYLAQLPLTQHLDQTLFTHASPRNPADWTYITTNTRAAPAFQATDARLTLCGHVHKPALYSIDHQGIVRECPLTLNQPMPLLPSRRWLAVVGSTGQPRDGSPHAAWAMLEPHQITFRRTPYDVQATVDKIRAAGLPEALAQRLLNGN
ncbi:metallophosphoesterase family protein [Neogemmobacter tilapiae]|uniref:Metallophosphoesterase n=1 Tax=Neogemmobacter tilapiae TaxID=875041 RepID=A0A918TFG2_9RHOB|nr:metallophosphoesterase family protein [Gemmobacter tilapiae]GHC45739.1 metallophosphoesterase [Gemmobacter tilapiae]